MRLDGTRFWGWGAGEGAAPLSSLLAAEAFWTSRNGKAWSGVPPINVNMGKTRQHNYYVGGGAGVSLLNRVPGLVRPSSQEKSLRVEQGFQLCIFPAAADGFSRCGTDRDSAKYLSG